MPMPMPMMLHSAHAVLTNHGDIYLQCLPSAPAVASLQTARGDSHCPRLAYPF